MRLFVSPATPFSDASLPNHTKMFELVHMVTSMEDFGPYMGNILDFHGKIRQKISPHLVGKNV